MLYVLCICFTCPLYFLTPRLLKSGGVPQASFIFHLQGEEGAYHQPGGRNPIPPIPMSLFVSGVTNPDPIPPIPDKTIPDLFYSPSLILHLIYLFDLPASLPPNGPEYDDYLLYSQPITARVLFYLFNLSSRCLGRHIRGWGDCRSLSP